MTNFPPSPAPETIVEDSGWDDFGRFNWRGWWYDGIKWFDAGFLFGHYLPLTGGVVTGDLNVDGNMVLPSGNQASTYGLTINTSTGIGILDGNPPDPGIDGAISVASSERNATFFYSTLAAGFALMCRRDNTQSGVGSGFITFSYSPSYRAIGYISTNNGTTTTYSTTSDYRLKTDIEPLPSRLAAEIIDALQPLEFNWRGHENEATQYGFSAQDVNAVVPQAVSEGQGELGDDDYVPWGMDERQLIPVMIAEMQSLRARVRALENERHVTTGP